MRRRDDRYRNGQKGALQEAKKMGVELGTNGKVLSQINRRKKVSFVETIRKSLEFVRDEAASLSGMSRRLNQMTFQPTEMGFCIHKLSKIPVSTVK